MAAPGIQTREVKTALAACSVSTKATAQVLMPKHFYAPFTWQHDEIAAALDDDAIRKVNIIGSRGLGKTSLVALAHCGRSLLFRKRKFIVYVTGSVTNAIEKTENLKRQCLTNPAIRKLFGSIKMVDQDFGGGMDEIFTKAGWIANGATLVLPRGALQQVRGLLFDEHRPDLVILDDVENVKACQNEDLRDELWEWFRGDVENCVAQFDHDWKIVYIDTVKHQDCIPLKLEELSDWHTIKLPVAEEIFRDGEVVGMRSVIPELITHEEMQEIWDSHVASGLEDVFYRERMCKAVSGFASAFRRDYFRYYDESDQAFRNMLELLDTQSIVLVDPAKTENPRSAETAIVGVTVNLGQQSIYVREVQADRLHPEETARDAVAMANRINAKVIGIEDAGMGAYAMYPLKNYLRTKKCLHRLIPLKARKGVLEKGKIERIRSLIPFYRQGQVYHNPACSEGLEAQLVSFPRSRRFDMMDALAYVVDALEQAEMYFFPDGGDDYTAEAAESEYREFELEDAAEALRERTEAEGRMADLWQSDPWKEYRRR